MRVTDTASFIVKSNIVHSNRYDYSQSVYTRQKDKLKIVCPTHGVFEQTPDSHMRGSGCNICAGNVQSNNEDFKTKANLIHNNNYEYDCSEYSKASDKISIRCKSHGIFSMTANKHLSGRGCQKCKKEESYNSESFDSYVSRAKNTHGEKYKYVKKYRLNNRTWVEYICDEHGTIKQNAFAHLKGISCRKCSNKKLGSYATLTNDEFIERANKKHNFTYDYSLSTYLRAAKKIKIICKKHGVFLQTPNHHLNGQGCQMCANEKPGQGWSRAGFVEVCGNRVAKTYLVRLYSDSESFYKVGITCKSIKARFHGSKYNVEIISHIESSPERVFDIEKMIHRKLKKFKYTPDINFGGMTECFSELTNEVKEFFGVSHA